MDINALLKGKTDCSCGRNHSCDIRSVVIGKNAVSELSTLLSEFKNILLIADQNTWAVGGEAVKSQIFDRLENTIVFDSGDHFLVPNEETCSRIEAGITEDTDYILGIGSGVIQDTCKYVSFLHKLPYGVVATAPSMDGYASVGAAMIWEQQKVTFDAHIPDIIIGDVDMLKTAPMDMLRSGYGDIIGKYSALNDWKLSALINGEYFCRYVYDLTYDMINRTLAIADGILAREEAAVQTLMEALVVTGIAMSFVGNSRPASGSEHHCSHFFEIVGLLNKEPYFNHGIDVIYSTWLTERIREAILSLDSFEQAIPFDENEWEAHIRRVYTDAADGIIALQKKAGWYQKDYLSIYREKESEIRAILSEVPASTELEKMLLKVELPLDRFFCEYGEQKIREAMFVGKDLKVRYSVLWLGYLLFYGGTKSIPLR